MQGTQANYIAGTPYLGAEVRIYAGPGGNRGEVSAWDPVAAKTVWSVKEQFPGEPETLRADNMLRMISHTVADALRIVHFGFS